MTDLKVESKNPAWESLKIYEKYEQYLNDHVDTVLKGTDALYKKVEDYANLSSQLRRDFKDAPPYIDYSEDPEMQNLIDLLNQDTQHQELNADKKYRLDQNEALIMIDHLDILIKRYQNEAHAESLSLQPKLLHSIEITQCFRKMIEYMKEFLSLVQRNMKS
jgi:hypothetical protein